MELTALALFLAATPQALQPLPDYTTLDGTPVSHSVGSAALRNGHAVLIGELLVGTFAAASSSAALLFAA
ncbi:hypothetical protein MTX78_23350 (plasmid) [Hymenobacter tibetensis]|uniref:Uncharacterized protein n=1 Tax=Hymenobacter tibetensis TaxID=497967 RepID=A0ABY4D4B7_9BACT|nr:hypothetical protein [Hymenobacter tibetensis]UOG77285.1 hypothetical protein MTX78_23350 [Hymenobacter tibetensis]